MVFWGGEGCFGLAAARSCQGVRLLKAAQALSLFDGYEFVTPDQIQEIAVPVLAHRLVMEPQAHFSGKTAQGVIENVIKLLPVPA